MDFYEVMELKSPVLSVVFGLLLQLPLIHSSNQRSYCPRDPNGAWPTNRINTTQQLIWLRNEMGRGASLRGPTLDAFIITSDDEHQGEFVADRDKRRQFISGFSGSSGDAVVTRNRAALWTDNSYYVQADQELDCNWLLMKHGKERVLTITDWLRQELKPGSRVGADPKLVPANIWDDWLRDLAVDRIALIEVPNNPIDQIWTIGRPLYENYPSYPQHIEFAGDTWQNKVTMLRQNLTKLECDAMIITALDEIAWLLNIRGRDIPYSPFIRSYVIVMREVIHFYIPREKLSDSTRRHLRVDQYGPFGIRVHAYESIWKDIPTLSQIWRRVLIPSPSVYTRGVSQAVMSAVPPEKRLVRQSPIIYMKAKKNPIEADGMRKAHIRDAAALVDFMAFLTEQISLGKKTTEMSAAKTLDKYRKEQNYSQGISFPTMAAFGANGALPHYEPSPVTNRDIDDSGTLVLDSGGQYYDGTTDVTRTLHFGTPTAFQKEAYTRVLKGLIQLASLTFPDNIRTTDVDVLARSPLWDAGMNYRHGTGHGIGAFLGVHESPISIGYDSKHHRQQFKEGYFFTNEPGYYKEGDFGIRLENVLEVIAKDPPHAEEQDGIYLGFYDVTLVPFESKLIDYSSLSPTEIDWLNLYNERIRQEVGAELKKQSRMKGFHYLWDRTKHLTSRSSTLKSGCLVFSLAFFVQNLIF